MRHYYLTCLKPAGTNSFRLSATKLYNGMGGNSQNMDKKSLYAYEAREGMAFVTRDQSGAEALIVAHIAPDGVYRSLFRNGIKPHTYLALNQFHDNLGGMFDPANLIRLVPDELIKQANWKFAEECIQEDPVWYPLGKKICHASTYRMGPRTFQRNVLKETFGLVRLSYKEAKEFLDAFYRLFPEIGVWQSEVVKEAIDTGKLTNLLGDPRVFGRNFDESYAREIISWIPQSTVGEITHDAVDYTKRECKKRNLRVNLVSNKHDAFTTECFIQDIPEVNQIMGEGLAVKMTGRDGIEFTMRCDSQVGKNWGKYHKSKNPLGMKGYNGIEHHL